MITNKIAIIGISGRFPDALTPIDLFNNCLKGHISINKYTDHELQSSGISHQDLNNPNYVKFGSFINDIDKFDSNFFKMTDLETKLTDPQHRIFLKCAWEALENSGYTPQKYKGTIGVFASTSINTYLINNILNSKYAKNNKLDYISLIGNDKDFLASKVSYKLGLSGPSIMIQSACSSSLSCIHYACKSILDNECNIAIAGGVSIKIPQKSGYYYKEGSVFSKDGQVRPFDNNATGIVNGNGCGIVILKELNSAINDNDYIYAIINSTALNNDGNRKVGYAAPSVAGQIEVISKAIKKSKLDLNKLKYIETHGTGTKLGDPIEVLGLAKAYSSISLNRKIPIGSIKANIGHLDVASGIAGLIKTALILNKNIIPKSVNFNMANSHINFDKTPFYIETQKNIMLNKFKKNYVAISSFGIGGTNVHIILENYISKTLSKSNNHKKSYILPLSANSITALKTLKKKLYIFLSHNRNIRVCDLAFSLCFGRTDFKFKDYLIASNITEILLKLSNSFELNNKNSIYNSSLISIANKWKNNENISWQDYFQDTDAHRIPLPTYPFQEKSFWISRNDNAFINSTFKKTAIKQFPITKSYIYNLIIKIWSEFFKKDIKENDDFFDFGMESLIAIEMLNNINSIFKLNLEISIFAKLSTPKLLANYIYELKKKEYAVNNENHNLSNIVKIMSGNSQKKLFLIHPAGGSSYCYNLLSRHLNCNINIYSISYPKNLNCIDISNIENLSKFYLEQIIKIQPTGELFIGGYSFGGNIAINMATQINQYERTINKIFLIDSFVPSVYKMLNPTNNYINVFPFFWNAMTGNTSKIDFDLTFNSQNINFYINLMKDKNIIPQTLKNNDIEKMFNLWISNCQMLSLQSKKFKISNDLIVFYAEEKIPEFLTEFINTNYSYNIKWNNYTTGNITEYIIKGNHWSILSDDINIKKLASLLDSELKKL